MLRLIILLTLWISASTPLWADCRLGKIKDIEPIFDDSGVYLPAKINDKPALFKLDTGTAHSFLYRINAEAFGLPPSEFGSTLFQRYPIELVYHTNELRASIDSWKIGKWTGKNLFLPMSEQIADVKPGGTPVLGVLGEDFLSHFEVEIDIKAGLFALYRPEGCENADLAYWSKDYNVTDMINYNPHDPLIQIAGKLNGTAIVMQIASGRTFSAVSSSAARSRGVSFDSPDTRPLGTVTGVQGEAVDGWLGTFSNFALDEEKIGQAKIAFINFPKAHAVDIEHGSRLVKVEAATAAQMSLGSDFLRAHHVLISHSQQKVYFSYEGAAPFAVPKS